MALTTLEDNVNAFQPFYCTENVKRIGHTVSSGYSYTIKHQVSSLSLSFANCELQRNRLFFLAVSLTFREKCALQRDYISIVSTSCIFVPKSYFHLFPTVKEKLSGQDSFGKSWLNNSRGHLSKLKQPMKQFLFYQLQSEKHFNLTKLLNSYTFCNITSAVLNILEFDVVDQSNPYS